MAQLTTIVFRHSGGAGNSDPTASLGGAMSSTAVTNSSDENLFENIDLADAVAGETYYRCIYLLGNGFDYTALKAWISGGTPSLGTKIYIALGTSGVDGTEQTIADENTSPTSVIFTSPTSESSGVAIPDLDDAEYHAIWFKLVLSAGAGGYDTDYFRLSVGGVES